MQSLAPHEIDAGVARGQRDSGRALVLPHPAHCRLALEGRRHSWRARRAAHAARPTSSMTVGRNTPACALPEVTAITTTSTVYTAPSASKPATIREVRHRALGEGATS